MLPAILSPAIETLTLRFPAREETINGVRKVLDDALSTCAVLAKDRYRLIAAVDELSTNVAQHGRRGRQPSLLDLSLSVGARTLEVVLADRSPRFDPRRDAGKFDWDRLQAQGHSGGLGRYLVERVADRITYRPRAGGGNVVSVLIRRKG